uniref:NADH-ubiquinone oxidoreductase chain 2 n=1 Tax=Eurhadina exclamationis TaxID=2892960 RepID=A0A9E6XQE7_9HEMI|nr:NADH dehydrogenase subunit 2 [Eurhadina exclamationis]UGN61498.1 NADH dehydrogenase subunit 2 [Eurhadina exclamationis]
MKMNSSMMLFTTTMLMGILMSISSNNWIMMWCGLEISLISIIPLMVSKLVASSESTMKYFIMQSVSSTMLMLSMLVMVMSGDYNYNYLMMTALLIKMGVAPFHNWVLTVVEGLDLIMIYMILTINKIAPITLMSYTTKSLMLIILLTVITGSLLGLNQNSVKKMIGYSSIFNMGFVMSVLKYNWMWIMYMFMYSMLLMMLLMLLHKNKILLMNQMTFIELLTNKLSMWMVLLSMGGLPPLIGFSIKYMVMLYMISMKMLATMAMMLMTSLIIMFFYLRMTFLGTMNYSMIVMTKMFQLNEMSMLILLINLITLPSIMMMKMFT